jgi:hypothetical protein
VKVQAPAASQQAPMPQSVKNEAQAAAPIQTFPAVPVHVAWRFSEHVPVLLQHVPWVPQSPEEQVEPMP